ncbi:MAG: hypothetical protein U9O64_06785 [Campylobacterota bacterium]|nr:hypothetical protein [Campylobacterota bacterium]
MIKPLKFLLGIILAQVATYALIVLSPTSLDWTGILRMVVPLFFIALVIAFWFSSISTQHGKDRFASEKEKIRKEAEKDKERVIKEAQRNITVQSAKTNAKANFKVGAAFAGALGVGALFVFAQMVTAGLLALAATGGAMGGYYIRSKRAQRERLQALSSTAHMEIVSSKSSGSHLLKKKVDK